MALGFHQHAVRRYSGLVGGGAAIAIPGNYTAATTFTQPPLNRSTSMMWSCRVTNTSATAATLTAYVQDSFANKVYIAFNLPLAVAASIDLLSTNQFIDLVPGDVLYASITGASATADIYASFEINSP